MADSSVKLVVENWIRRERLPKVYGQTFRPGSLQLVQGGDFNFDAVSADNGISGELEPQEIQYLADVQGNLGKVVARYDLRYQVRIELGGAIPPQYDIVDKVDQ